MKKLPINIKPFLKTYQYTALPVAAITSDDNDFNIFLANNFVQTQFNISKNKLDFWHKRFIYWDCVDVQNSFRNDYITSSHSSIIDIIQFAINNNLYVYTQVNEFYIRNRDAYQKYNFVHDILVYGYTKDSLLVFGYNNSGYLTTEQVPVCDFVDAFKSITEPTMTHLFKYADYNHFYLNLKQIKENLKEYIHSTNSDFKYSYNDTTGRYTYGIKAIKQSFTIEINRFCQLGNVDIRNIDCIIEHKRTMVKRLDLINCFIEIGDLIEHYSIIMSEVNKIKNVFIKALLTNSFINMSTIRDISNYIFEEEKEILKNLINLL
jgi:hypothetical protein